jgi:hypothetical protein
VQKLEFDLGFITRNKIMSPPLWREV